MRVAKTDTTAGLVAGLAGSIVGKFRSREMVAEAVTGGLLLLSPSADKTLITVIP